MLFYNEVEDTGEINMGWTHCVSHQKKKDHDEILTPRTQNVTIFENRIFAGVTWLNEALRVDPDPIWMVSLKEE